MYDASLYTLIGIPNLSTACAINAHFATSSQMTEMLTWFIFICSWLRMAHQPMDGEAMVCKPRCSSNDCLFADPASAESPFQISSSRVVFACLVQHCLSHQREPNIGQLVYGFTGFNVIALSQHSPNHDLDFGFSLSYPFRSSFPPQSVSRIWNFTTIYRSSSESTQR